MAGNKHKPGVGGSREFRQQAVALARGDGDGHAAETARVLAKGYGEVAEQILARAREHGIYVHDSPELVSLLMHLDLDAEIPPSLYQVIAELLIWLRSRS